MIMGQNFRKSCNTICHFVMQRTISQWHTETNAPRRAIHWPNTSTTPKWPHVILSFIRFHLFFNISLVLFNFLEPISLGDNRFVGRLNVQICTLKSEKPLTNMSVAVPVRRNQGRCVGSTCVWQWGCLWPPPPHAACCGEPGRSWSALPPFPHSLCQTASWLLWTYVGHCWSER